MFYEILAHFYCVLATKAIATIGLFETLVCARQAKAHSERHTAGAQCHPHLLGHGYTEPASGRPSLTTTCSVSGTKAFAHFGSSGPAVSDHVYLPGL